MLTFEEALQNVQANKDEMALMICFRETLPESLRGYLPDERTILTQYVLEKVTAEIQDPRHYIIHPHKLTDEQLRQVREAIENPVAIIRADGRVVIVTDVLDYKDTPILAILGNDLKNHYNYIASIYGKDNLFLYLYNKQAEHALSYLDTKRMTEMTSKMVAKMSEHGTVDAEQISDYIQATLNICQIYKADMHKKMIRARITESNWRRRHANECPMEPGILVRETVYGLSDETFRDTYTPRHR
jgi:hypothetical protein